MAHVELTTVQEWLIHLNRYNYKIHIKYRKKQTLLNDNYLNNINRSRNMQSK